MRIRAAAAMLSAALLAVGTAAGGAAEAAPRRDGGRPAAEARGSQPVVHQHSARARGQGIAAIDARQASARHLCPRGGQPQRGGRCRGEGAFAGAGGRGGLRWQVGLPPAEHVQRDCPGGTLATLAHGHTDVVRCMPL